MSRDGEKQWHNAVVYHVYPRSFADSNGDGIGDLPGITERLDHIARLGVDVLWISPFYPSPQHDGGYDISDYQDVDPAFGTLADFDELVTELHRRNIRLIIDLVVNHTSDEHPWFIESRSSRLNPKRDWYWWRPARDGMQPGSPGAEPSNWGAAFSGPAWTLDDSTAEYYLHLFSSRQPDLNWENPDVRQAIYAMMRWWLDRGVDGFRMDVINMISKHVTLPDGRVTLGGPYGDGRPYYTCGPRIHQYLQEMHREVFAEHADRLLKVGEMPGVTVAEARLFTDPARAELDIVFQFEHVQLDQGATKWMHHPLRLADLKITLNRWQKGLVETGWNSLYWCNHDQPRIVSRYGDDGAYRIQSAKTLATILHLHKGTPFIYQGEELGMTNAPFTTIDEFRDVESRNYYDSCVEVGAPPAQVLQALQVMGRDNSRTPMQWDGSLHAGFTTASPWIAVNENYRHINADTAWNDSDSILHHYRRLIELRHTEPAIVYGEFTMVLDDLEHVYAFTRRHAGTELLVLGNFSAETVALPDAQAWMGEELLISNYPAPAELSDHMMLQPWESRVYRRMHDDKAPT